MANESPKVWARVDPATRERIRVESKRLFDGNESLLVRKAIVRFLDGIDRSRRRAEDLEVELIEAAEEAVA